ncbi:MAG: hypothetical protein NTW86_32925, partial [Candidatus Sumerlaeota bacterium]|nr:hypothetical protein [Candidatus Sumerlaeota bacterium]
ELRGDGGAIPAERIETRWTQRLLKRVQYKQPREDARLVWRFLWREAPERIDAGQLRHLVVTVRPPDDAKPGLYRGQLSLSSSGKEIAALPVELRVPAFQLEKPEGKRVGCYYRDTDKSDEQVERELDDIRDHGGAVLMWHATVRVKAGKEGSATLASYDVEPVRRAVLLQKEYGFGPPFIVDPAPIQCATAAGLKVRNSPEFAQEVLASDEFRRLYAGSIEKVTALEKELGAGEFVLTWMDEVFNENRYEPWEAFCRVTRELCSNRIYITIHNRDPKMIEKADPWMDIRCYNGHVMDEWLSQGHTFEELREELHKAGDEAWAYYNIRDIGVTPEWVRLCNGYWLWESPLTAHVPWIYYSYGGSPFDDLDSDHHDFGYAAPHPTKPEMVSTLEWEAFREGWDDLRYLATLQKALANAEKRGGANPAMTEAKKLLEEFRSGDPRVPAQAERLTAQDYERRREAMAKAIEGLAK